MKSLLLASAMIAAAGTMAFADGSYWVVGNRVGGSVWFGDGPYQSLDDARLARSTIAVCPEENPPPAGTADKGKPG